MNAINAKRNALIPDPDWHQQQSSSNWQQPAGSSNWYQPPQYQPSIPDLSQPPYYSPSSSAYHQYPPSSSAYHHYAPSSSDYHQNSPSNSYSSYRTSGGSAPAVNRVITVNGNEYHVVKVLGRSSHKPVYRVERHGNSYALKEGVERNEIEAIRACQGEGVIGYIESDLSGNLVMEMGKKSLAEILENDNLNGPVYAGIIKSQLEKGLETIHNAGYVHNDLDVLNVIYFPRMIFKITDFGAAIQSTSEEDRKRDRGFLANLIQRIEQNQYGNQSDNSNSH